ncbi:interleukin-4 receptor subunit alpha-like [Pristis pectinata]|uniref:interleukin-4 receptor subunit alpha-like n=1 Tax=Pristis pectinata TaxID=685728 RepID=UPI00223DA8FE|nr:interleukin-4 receptor subunit alpha-like [Pristis pectinata]XP_051876752.1 interleukin-4 receptor subunit alpha-like [Pristis pectinata]XP_051876753.1 interleukin-4 receptor subunit alpha-like [Pristis pectinata]
MVIWCLLIIAFWLCQGRNAQQSEQLECFNDYLQEVTCSWPAKPDTNCSTDYILWYQILLSSMNFLNITDIDSLPGSVCQCKIRKQDLTYSTEHKIKVYYNKSEIFSKAFSAPQTIKPLAPYHLSINTSKDKQAFLVWVDEYTDESIGDYIEYEVAYMKTGGNWKKFSKTSQKMLALNTLLEPGYTYHMKVHSKPTKSYSGIWSDWSPECQWSYESSEWISPTLIVLVCIFIPLPVALCFYAFQLAKKFWWEKIPSPLKSSVSKQIFNKPQINGFIFSENKIDDCKVEKISCMTEVSRERAKVEDTTEQLGKDSFTFPAFPHWMKETKHDEKTPFPGFGFPVLMDFPSLFPLPIEDLSLVPSDAPGYSLFNGVAKDQWVDEGDGYHPFTGNEEGSLPLTLSTYSLSPGPGREATRSSEQVGYQTFNSCVSKPWATVSEGGWDPGEQSSEALLMPLEPNHIESSEYMAASDQTFTASGKGLPSWERSGDHSTSHNFTPASGTDFLLCPFPLFPESLPSTTFPPSVPGKLEFQEPPSIHWGPGMSLSLAPSLYPPGKVT